MPEDVKAPTAQENDDNFSAAFAQIAALDDKPIPPEGIAAAAAEEPVAEEPVKAAEEPVTKAPAKAAETPVVEGLPTAEEEAARAAAAAPKQAAAPELTDDDLTRRLAGLIRKAEPAAPAQQQPQQTQQVQEPQLYSSDEMEFLETYVKDFPDVAKAEALIRRQEYQTIVGHVFREVAKEIQPLMQMVRTLSERTHLGDLQTTVPDYNTLRDQVVDWAGKQPAYLQPAYQHVIQRGTVEEVRDLIDRFKRDTGAIPPVPAAGTPGAPAKPETELPAAAKKAAAALAPVNSKRSSAVVATPEDFDGAFAQFAGTL